jgi:hypothetical protein
LQSVVTIESNKKQPSARLQEKIRNCVSVFRSLNETVNEVIEIGKSEGFTPLEIGQFIRNEMLKAGLHRSTAARYLPTELKNRPRGKQVAVATTTTVSRKLRQNTLPQKNKEFTFKGHLSKTSRNRLGFVFPATETKNLQRYMGKELTILIRESGGS